MADTLTESSPDLEPSTPAPPLTDWRAGLPEDLRGDKSLESFKDVPSLAKSYVEARKLIGTKQDGLVKVPGEKSTPEEVTAFHRALGVPESPDKYAIQRPEIALDGVWNEGAEKAFLADMHKVGAPPAVVQAAINAYGRWEQQKLHEAQREAQQVEADLRREWGPNYDANVGRANRALQQYGGDELVAYLGRTGLGRHPLMVKAFAGIGNAMVEAGALATEGDIGVAAEEAKARLAAIMADKAHRFHQPLHRDWQSAADEVLALRRIVAGTENKILATYRE